MDVARACVRCGGVFKSRHGGKPQKFCSTSCRVASGRDAEREVARLRPTTQVVTCTECGLTLQVSTRGTPRKFCSQACARRTHNRRQNRARLPLASPASRNCAHCGGQFVAKSRDRIYCYNQTCRQAAYQARKVQGVRLVKSHLVKCDGCGNAFTSLRPEARWCSKQCANRHWGNVRSRQRALPSAAKYTDLQIFERDRWRCHLCRKRVRKDVSRLHPDGATIDHLVPISQGGIDEPANVATAHWKCNQSKGVTAMGEQLALL